MTGQEIFRRVADMLDSTDRANYRTADDLAEELQGEVEDEATEEQHYAIAEQVEEWWAAQE